MKNNSKKQINAPKLQFPEFRGKLEWEERKLSEVLTEHGLKSTKKEEVFSVSVHKGLINQIEHLGRSFSAATTDHYNRVMPGDIVYTKSPTGNFPFGIIKQSKKGFSVIVSPLYGVFTPETYALGSILDAYFESPINVSSYLSSIVQKGAKNTININNKTFLSKSLILPVNKAEQQKIADCLTSVDELISAQSKKLEALKAHKKGLMQQLFPAEGETVPKLRFPEFRNAPEWRKRQLGEISDIKTGPFGSLLHEHDYVDIGTPIITVEHLGEIGITGNTPPKVSDIDTKRLGSYVLRKGDIVFSRVGSVDRCAIIGSDEEGWLFSGRLLRLRITTAEHYPKFLNHLLKHEPSREKIRNSAVGQTMPSLNTQILKAISLFLPSPAEQRKIADCLTSVDELISAQSKKLEALKAHKKGLMQQLFPSADEVRG